MELSENGRRERERERLCVLEKELENGHGELTAGRSGVQVDYSSMKVRLHGTEFHQISVLKRIHVLYGCKTWSHKEARRNGVLLWVI